MEFDFGFGSKTIYLVDSENLNDAWVGAIEDLGPRDQIFVFYTENSANMSVASISRLTAKENQVIWKRCFTGTNALDFQLVSQLGALIARHPRDTFVILSNDTGYDPVVRYWTVEGIKISRTSVQTGTPRSRRTSRGGVRYSSRNQNRSTPPAYVAQAKKETAKPAGGQRSTTADGRTASGKAKSAETSDKSAGAAKETTAAETRVKETSAKEKPANRKTAAQNAANEKAEEARTDVNSKKADAVPEAAAAGTEADAKTSVEAAAAETPAEKPGKGKKGKGKADSSDKAERSGKSDADGDEKKKKKKKDKVGKKKAGAEEESAAIAAKTPEEVALSLTSVSARTELPPVLDAQGHLHPRVTACIDALGTALSVRNMGDYHEALVHLLGSEDGSAAYQMVRGDRDWMKRLEDSYSGDRDMRVDNFIGAFLDYLGYPAEDSARIREIILQGNATNYAGLYRSFVHSFGANRGRQYYSLFKSSLKTIQQL